MNSSDLTLLAQCLEEVLEKPLQISAGTRIRGDLGLTSIDILDLIYTLEKKLGRSINVQRFFAAFAKNSSRSDFSVEEVLAYLRSEPGGRNP